MTKLKLGNDMTGSITGGPSISTTQAQYDQAQKEYAKNKKVGKYKGIATADDMMASGSKVISTIKKIPKYSAGQHEMAKKIGVKLPTSSKNQPVSSKNVVEAEAKLKPGLKRQF